MKIKLQSIWDFLNKEFVVMVFGVLILGLVAAHITDSWQVEQKQTELKLSLLQEFNEKYVTVAGYMSTPNVMRYDRGCLTAEAGLLTLSDPVQLVFRDKSIPNDFSTLTEILDSTNTDGGAVQMKFLEQAKIIRVKMMRELGQ